MKNVCYFNARFLAPICRFMGKNDIRYYLNGFSVEPAASGGVLLMATDGHTMMVARDPEGWVEKQMIIKPDASLISAAKKKGMGKLVIQAEGFASGLAFVLPSKIGKGKSAFPVTAEIEKEWIANPLTAVEHVSAVTFIDAAPMAWRRVLPKVEEKGPEGYCDIVANGHYLARFDGVFDDMMGLVGERRRLGGIRIQSFSENGSMAIRPGSHGLDAMGIIMPMRADRNPFDPAWMDAPTPKRRIRIRAGESTPLEAAE